MSPRHGLKALEVGGRLASVNLTQHIKYSRVGTTNRRKQGNVDNSEHPVSEVSGGPVIALAEHTEQSRVPQ